ncbi:MATE family efflux transporter [Microcoleus sp. A2-C5]|uniref:MATE family efflux transporter n=1 Tax=unclassified Microcoleus TaxID=2642155 RepID=UPI002FD26536
MYCNSRDGDRRQRDRQIINFDSHNQNSSTATFLYLISIYFVEGLGCGTETLVGNFKGKGFSQQLVPLARFSLGTALLVGLSFGGACWLFPNTVFRLLTNHAEVTENIDIFVPWLLLVLVFSSINFMLDGYFLGLTQGHTLRNVSLFALVVGFLPADIAAIKFESNHILWLSLLLFEAIRMVTIGVQFPKTFASDVEDLEFRLKNDRI